MKALNNKIETAFLTVCSILLVIFIVVTFTEVITRNYLKISIRWASEVAILCFVWSVFLGSAVAVRKRRHYIVELFPEKMVKFNLVLDIIGSLGSYAIIYVMVVHGIRFTQAGLIRYSVALSLPQAYFYASIPIAGVAMFLFTTEIMMIDIGKLKNAIKGGGNSESDSIVNG